MSGFVVYDKATGAIVAYGETTAGTEHMQAHTRNQVSMAGRGTDLDYVDLKTGEIKPKKPMAVQVNGAIVANLPPEGCILTIEGVDHPCDDTVAHLNFSDPGTYLVRVRSSVYLDSAILVTV